MNSNLSPPPASSPDADGSRVTYIGPVKLRLILESPRADGIGENGDPTVIFARVADGEGRMEYSVDGWSEFSERVDVGEAEFRVGAGPTFVVREVGGICRAFITLSTADFLDLSDAVQRWSRTDRPDHNPVRILVVGYCLDNAGSCPWVHGLSLQAVHADGLAIFDAEKGLAFEAERISTRTSSQLPSLPDQIRRQWGEGGATGTAAGVTPPSCPICGLAMVERTATQGANAGGKFWGCSTFPTCRGTRRKS